jgi:hypothetical protein
MPKCERCLKFFHPDWMLQEEFRGDIIKSCLFCKLDKQILTVEDEDGKIQEMVTKEQASVNYLKYLDELAKKPRIAEILTKAKSESDGKCSSIKC